MSCNCQCHPIFKACHEHEPKKLLYEDSLTICLKPENCLSQLREDLICSVCKNCVWRPTRCDFCRVYVCKRCIDPLNKNKFNKCPCCKEKFEPRVIHKTVTDYLAQLTFTCPDCNVQFNFKDALEHMKYCLKYLLKNLQ